MYGGSTEAKAGSGVAHQNVYGGSTEARAGSGAEHTNMVGGQTSGAVGEGATHTTPYGATAYVAPGGAYAYHPPTTVNVYGAGCYNCGGWAVAGAVATGAAIGAATTAGGRDGQQRRGHQQRVQRRRGRGSRRRSAACVCAGRDLPDTAAGCDDGDPGRHDLLRLARRLVQAFLRRERRVLHCRSDAVGARRFRTMAGWRVVGMRRPGKPRSAMSKRSRTGRAR